MDSQELGEAVDYGIGLSQFISGLDSASVIVDSSCYPLETRRAIANLYLNPARSAIPELRKQFEGKYYESERVEELLKQIEERIASIEKRLG